MGTQFELVDKRNRRRFDLDKLYVHGLDTGAPRTPAEVLAEYNAAAARRYGAKDPEEYYRDIVSRIWAFCEVAGWEIEGYNDAGFDDSPAGPVVDGRGGGEFDPDPCAEATLHARLRACAALGVVFVIPPGAKVENVEVRG